VQPHKLVMQLAAVRAKLRQSMSIKHRMQRLLQHQEQQLEELMDSAQHLEQQLNQMSGGRLDVSALLQGAEHMGAVSTGTEQQDKQWAAALAYLESSLPSAGRSGPGMRRDLHQGSIYTGAAQHAGITNSSSAGASSSSGRDTGHVGPTSGAGEAAAAAAAVQDTLPPMQALHPVTWQARWLDARSGTDAPPATILFSGSETWVHSASFDPSGTLLLTTHTSTSSREAWQGMKVTPMGVEGGASTAKAPALPVEKCEALWREGEKGRLRPGEAAWSPDGSRIVVGHGQDYTDNGPAQPARITVYDAATGDALWQAPVSAAALADAQRADDDPGSSAAAAAEYALHDVTALAWSPCSKIIAAGNAGGTCTVWDAAGGKQLAALETRSVVAFTRVSFSPSGSLLVTLDATGVIRVWAAGLGYVQAGSTQMHGCSDLAWLPGSEAPALLVNGELRGVITADGKLVASRPFSGLNILSAFTLQPLTDALPPPPASTSPEGEATAVRASEPIYMSSSMGRVRHQQQPPAPPCDTRTERITAMAVAPAGAAQHAAQMLVTGTTHGRVLVWDMDTWSCVRELRLSVDASGATQPAGLHYKGRDAWRIRAKQPFRVVSLAVSATGVLAASTIDKGVWVWQPPSGEVVEDVDSDE